MITPCPASEPSRRSSDVTSQSSLRDQGLTLNCPQPSHIGDSQLVTLVSPLPAAWHSRISVRTDWTGLVFVDFDLVRLPVSSVTSISEIQRKCKHESDHVKAFYVFLSCVLQQCLCLPGNNYCLPVYVHCKNVSVRQVMTTACPSMHVVTTCLTAMVTRMKMIAVVSLALVFTAVVTPLSVCTRPTFVTAGASVL